MAELKTKEKVVEVARAVVAGRKRGNDLVRLGRHTFKVGPSYDEDGNVVGFCSRFVRQVYEEACGLKDGALLGGPGGWAGGSAKVTEQNLRRRRKAIDESQVRPGDIVGFNDNNGKHGHIGIWLGNGQVAENTSSGVRGNPRRAGTKITPFRHIGRTHLSGFFSVLPSGSGDAPVDPPEPAGPASGRNCAVVLYGKVIPCSPMLEANGKMTLLAEPYLEALGVDPSVIPSGVIHANGRSFGAELTSHCPKWMLTEQQFHKTPQGYRWYPQREGWGD